MSQKSPPLVVLQSWSDCPPKVKGIAPNDDERERSVRLEPDHQGQFLTQEITDPEKDIRFTPRGRTFSAGSKNAKRENKDSQNGVHNIIEEPLFMRRKNGQLEKNILSRHSYTGFCDSSDSNSLHGHSPSPDFNHHGRSSVLGRSLSNLHLSPVPPDTLNIRPGSAGTVGSDQLDGSSSNEYTPPPSPVTGRHRYRNLGSELAATIPKRAIKSNWITGIKSRWLKMSTTHPDYGRRSTLKSYSSTPSLVQSSAEGVPFYNPLYKLSHYQQSVNHLKSINRKVDILSGEEESDRSQSSLSNAVSYSPSPPPLNNSPIASLRQQIVYNSSRPNGLQKYNSLTDFSEEDYVFFGGSVSSGVRSLAESPYEGQSSSGYGEEHPPLHTLDAADECVLVEVIRKAETPNKVNNEHEKLDINGAKNEKIHSTGGLEPSTCNKFIGVKVEESPSKVARIKENIKRFGRFGRTQSEKISIKLKSEREKSNKIQEEDNKDVTLNQEESIIPIPITRKKSKKSLDTKDNFSTTTEEEQLLPINVNQPKPQETHDASKPTNNDENKLFQLTSESVNHDKPLELFGVGSENPKISFHDLKKLEGEEESVSSFVGDLDRSISSHLQSSFIVHKRENNESGERLHVDVTKEDINERHLELKVLEESVKNDDDSILSEENNHKEIMFRRYRDKVDGTLHSSIQEVYAENGKDGLELLCNNSNKTSNSGREKFPKNALSNNGIATAHVPVQAINRHVTGYAANSNIYANSVDEEDDHGSGSGSATSAESRSNDFEWQNRSFNTRDSFRGFCEGLLQHEKVTLQVPEIVEASISFDNEDSGSSIDRDEERENSVDYISVADVKVTHVKKSEKANCSKESLPDCVICLDIGSRGSGYSCWIKDEDDCIRIGHVDLGSSCPKSHKMPSWISADDLSVSGYDDEDENEISATSPTFGFQALNKFMADQTQSHLFIKWREYFNEGATFPYTLESKANEEELQFIMRSAIKHYAKIALDQIAQRKIDNSVVETIFVVAIPSNFDLVARQLVRDSAFGSGLISRKDGLVLIEDSCAAGIYAFHAIKPKISKIGTTSYLSVDIGGVYLHTCGFEYSSGKLYQILVPRSQPISDCPESLFEAELSVIFTPSFIFNYQSKYKAGWLKLMSEFEQCKNMYDPMEKGSYYLFVPSSFVDHFRRFTSMEVEDALESSDLLWSKVGALGIPYWKMQRLLQPMMEFIKNHVTNLLKNRSYEFLVLTGGRSGSRYLVDYIKNSVRDFSVDVAVPKEYNAAVVQGGIISLTNLAPRLIIKSPFSIGVGVMTPFIEEEHPKEKRVFRDGKYWCADVWDSLIKVGEELEMNRIALKRSYVGAQPGQSLLILPLFQSSQEPKFVTESSVRKCCEFKFNSGQRAWQEVELVIKCRPSELLIMAVDDGITKNVVVLDFAC